MLSYYADSAFCILPQLHVYDKRSGRELGSIHQRLFTFLPEFEIVVNGQTQGSIRKQFSLFLPRYEVDYHGWDVEGDFMGWDYRVTRGGTEIMSISKELFNWTDTYVIDVADPKDSLCALMLVLAIDAEKCSRN